MRVYELAKQLGMENRELIPELKRLGIPVASHSSALDDDSVRVALEKLTSKVRSGEAAGAHEAKKVVRSSREAGASHERGHAIAHEEPQKPDKKRILIKKKREEGAEDAAASLAAAEAAFAPTAPAGAEVPVVGAEVDGLEAAPVESTPADDAIVQPPVVTVSEEPQVKPVQAPPVVPPPPDALVTAKKKSCLLYTSRCV